MGLKTDGTAVAKGYNLNGQCNVSSWTDITQIAAGMQHTLGIKSGGTVVAKGWNYYGQCNVSSWSNITQVAAGELHSAGLKSDGRVVAAGDNNYSQCNTGSWTNIKQIAAGGYHTLGLKSNGTAVHAGTYGSISVGSWTGIEQVAVGKEHALGLKSDGTLVSSGGNDYRQRDVSSWTDITQVAAGQYHSVGLKSDGTVVATGYNSDGQCNVSSWTDIIQVSAGTYHTLGLKSDGTVVSCGDNDYGQRNVSGWQLMTPPTITTGTATGVGNTSATLNLSYTVGNFPPVDVYFGYKKSDDSAWTYTSPVSRTDDGDYSELLTGLAPGTTYDFKAMLTYSSATLEGSTVQFTMGRASPTVASVPASSISTGSATLNLSYTTGDYSPVDIRFAYKLCSDSAWSYTSWVSRTAAGTFSQAIGGLTADSTYDFRGELHFASSEIPGSTLQFSTSKIPPAITTLPADDTGQTSACLKMNFSPGGYTSIDIRFAFKKHALDEWTYTSWVSQSSAGAYQETVAGLMPGTQYDFRAEVRYGDTTACGNTLPFTTLQTLIGAGTSLSSSSSPSFSPSSITQSTVSLPNITVQSASLSDSNIRPGTPVTVTAILVNAGAAKGASIVKLYINGIEETSQGIQLEGGQSAKVFFTVNRSEPGTYMVNVNNTLAGNLKINWEITDIILLISICLIFFSLVLGVIYVRTKRS